MDCTSVICYRTDRVVSNVMEQSPSWEADSSSASQAITCNVWNSKAHYRAHNIPQFPLSWARSMQPTFPSYCSKMYCNIILPYISKSSKSPYPFKIPHQTTLHMFHTPALIIILDLITQIIFTGAYRSWSPSLCNFLQYPVASSLSGPNVVRNTPASNALSLCSSFYIRSYIIFLCVQPTAVCAAL